MAASCGVPVRRAAQSGMKPHPVITWSRSVKHANARPARSAPPGRRIPNVTVTASQINPTNAGAVRLLTGLLTTASNAPPRPAIPADTANNETFDQPAPIPDVRAATSELRTASTARPDDDRCRL